MYDQNLRKIPLLAVSTQLPSMLSCLRRLQSINHTIENQSPQMIQQITTLQIPQQHDMETIRQSIEGFSLLPFTESEDLYDSDSDGDNTACHSLSFVVRFAPQDQLFISRRPNNLNCPINSHCTLEYGNPCSSTLARTTLVVNRTADHDAPKKGLLLAIKLHIICLVI